MAAPRSKQTPRPVPTFDHLAKKPPVEVRDVIPLDEDAAIAFKQAENEVQTAELLGDEDRVKKAVKAVKAAEAKLRETSIEVVFRSIGRPKYEALKRAHPPTDEQIAEYKRLFGGDVPEYNVDTFPIPLIAASCVQPKMTEQQVASLVEEHEWNAGEFAALFNMAIRANTQRRTVNWGN